MSDVAPDSRRLSLFDRVLVGVADDREFVELERLLAGDAAAAQQFLDFASLEGDLRHALRTSTPAFLAGGPGRVVATTPAPGPPRGWARRRLLVAPAAALCAAAALLAWGAPWMWPADPQPVVTVPPGPVAFLAATEGAVWGGEQVPPGHAIREGEGVTLTSGAARIGVGFGAEIAAEGPCSITFVSQDRVRLHYGELTVQVAEWAKGFTVETEAMDVIDLGTTFTVAAAKDASAQASVIKGQVRVSPKTPPQAGPRSLLVSAGEALRVERDGLPVERAPHGPLAPQPLGEGAFNPYKPLALFNTGAGFSVGDEDPHWQVVAGPRGRFAKPRYAVVCPPHERYLANDRAESQWVSVADWETAEANCIYTFRTGFDLTGFDLASIRLFGRFLADNGIREVRVNGAPVRLESWVDNVFGQSFGAPQFRTVNVTRGLKPGANTLEIDVWNGTYQHMTADTPNPMALRVEWFAFGQHHGEVAVSSRVGAGARAPRRAERDVAPRGAGRDLFGGLLAPTRRAAALSPT